MFYKTVDISYLYTLETILICNFVFQIDCWISQDQYKKKTVGNGLSKHLLATQPGLGRTSLKLFHAMDYIRPRRKWLSLQNKGQNALRKRI